ncbi:MAG TPA: POTRA domain-containing protein [Blastocatellia bacterium]|nr:POTRA domain-containing protein [Blastocatellia bacterium]
MRIMCLLLLLPIVCASLQTRPSARHVTALADTSQADEGTPKTQCGRVLIRGSEQLTEIELCRLLGELSNNPLEPESRKSVEEEILKEYHRRGFLDSGLSWSKAEKTADASAPDVTVDVTEGPVYHLRRLEMIGNENTHDRVIRRRVALQEGAVFDEELLELSIKRINQLGIFEDFTRGDVEVRPNKKGHFVDLTFQLREKP